VNPQPAALPPLTAQRAPQVPATIPVRYSRFALWQPRTSPAALRPAPQQPAAPDLNDLDQRVRLSGEW